MAAEVDYKELLLQLIASITLADHLGDVSDDVAYVLKLIGMSDIDWGDLDELRAELGKRGVTTLYGTSIKPEDDEE